MKRSQYAQIVWKQNRKTVQIKKKSHWPRTKNILCIRLHYIAMLMLKRARVHS